LTASEADIEMKQFADGLNTQVSSSHTPLETAQDHRLVSASVNTRWQFLKTESDSYSLPCIIGTTTKYKALAVDDDKPQSGT
jgi:hypothetical protein